MSDFLSNNTTAVFTLLGVAIGTILSGIINYLIKTKEYKLKVVEKLLDKKLDAHEEFITRITLARATVDLEGKDKDGYRLVCPIVARSSHELDEYVTNFRSMLISNERWLSSKIKKECNLFFFYLGKLRRIGEHVSDEIFQDITSLLINDFIEFSYNLEELSHDYFNKDITKLKFKTDRGAEYYWDWITNFRYKKTVLFKKRILIEKLIHNKAN